MITDGYKTKYYVGNYIDDARNWYSNKDKVMEDPMERVLFDYFIGDYEDFVKKRKAEIVSGNNLLSKIKKYFLTEEDASFKEKSYQSYGFGMLLQNSFPILSNENKTYEKIKIRTAQENYIEVRFISA
jgi:hypothetical protein